MVPKDADGKPTVLLTEDGQIFCGTCHLFHDPAVSEAKLLAASRLPGKTGLAGAVRARIEQESEEIAGRYNAASAGAAFSSKGTTALRETVSDGGLCRSCHGDLTR